MKFYSQIDDVKWESEFYSDGKNSMHHMAFISEVTNSAMIVTLGHLWAIAS
jgi:hypothetical protein